MDEFRIYLTDEQLRQTYDHIERIDRHFDECCASSGDRCKYDDLYNKLYDLLNLAGLSNEKSPINRAGFENWLIERNETEEVKDV